MPTGCKMIYHVLDMSWTKWTYSMPGLTDEELSLLSFYGGSERGSITHTKGLGTFFFKSFIYTGKYNRSLVTCFHCNPVTTHMSNNQ